MFEMAIQSGAARDAMMPVLDTHDTSNYGRAIFRRWMLQTSAASITSLGVVFGLVQLIRGF